MSIPDSRTHVWIVSELYYPEEAATGHILTRIAEGLAEKFHVHVICGQPSYVLKGHRSPWRESHHHVEIRRCWATTWNKDVLLKRFANLVTISLSLFLAALVRVRKNERVLVVTNPPLLPFLVSLACRLRGAKCILLIHDVYPEVAVAAGLLRPHQFAVRLLHRCVRRLYRSVAKIIVLGRDMQAVVREKCGKGEHNVAIIHNFADVDSVYPQPRSSSRLLRELGLLNKFVVQYAGNMGPVHDVEGLVRCAEALHDHDNIHILVIGSGAKKRWLECAVRDRRLQNVSILAPLPRQASCEFLSACDVAISMFVPGMFGVSVPSRTYNVLAAGKPMIAVTDKKSELALLLEEEKVGWTVQPDDTAELVTTVLKAYTEPEELNAMGLRARLAAETKYHPDTIVREYAKLIDELG